jgi:hypothetical protein
VALLGVTLVKYYCINEYDAHTIETSNNLFKIIGDSNSGLAWV